MNNDTSYVLSGSSSTDKNLTGSRRKQKKKISTGFQARYKKSTVKRYFGKKRRKSRFHKKIPQAHLIETLSSSKLLPSLKRVYEKPVTFKTSQIFDVKHLQQVFNNAHVCLDGGRLELITDVSTPIGLFHKNVLRCTKCHEETPLTNFPAIHPIESQQQEPNKRLSLAAAITGVGYRATKGIMSTLCLSITSERSFLHQLHKYYDALHGFAQKHFETIIKDIKNNNNNRDQIMNITVSLDGTWKRRGHISNFGIVFIIDVQSGMCIDYEVMSLLCEACNIKNSKSSKTQFLKWYEKHQPFCCKNYDGTSKSMEKQGAIRLFQKSLINGLRYKNMLCDGDASAFEGIKYHYVSRHQQEYLIENKPVETNENVNMDNGEDSNGGEDANGDEYSGDGEDSNGDEYSGGGENSNGDEYSGGGEDSTGDEYSGDGEDSTGDEDSGGGEYHGRYEDSSSDVGEYKDESNDVEAKRRKPRATSAEEGNWENANQSDDDNNDNVKLTVEEKDDDDDFNDTFNDLIVIKEDCINHVGKRVMKYLMELKREKIRRISVPNITTNSLTSSSTKQAATQQQLLGDNKRWGGGAGRMTNSMMKKLSNSYGLAIRQASSSSCGKEMNEALDIMQQHCQAAFYHYMKTNDHDEEEQHRFCPKTKDTWCTYHQSKSSSNNSNNNVKKKRNQNYLDPIFYDILQPMIDKLTSRQLLRRCLRAITQNSNESLNSIVWSILSKSKHHGFRSVRGAAALAAMFFNSGRSILMEFFNQCGISTNKTLFDHLLTKDNRRILKSKRNYEQRRNQIQRKAMDRQNSIKAQLDSTDYDPGSFNL